MKMTRRLAVAWVASLCPACSFCVPIGAASGALSFDRYVLTPVEVPSRTGDGGRRVQGLLVKDRFPYLAVGTLRDGDVILSLDGVPVQDRWEPEEVGRELGPGRRVRIAVLRGGEATEVQTRTERVGPYLELAFTVLPPLLGPYPGLQKTILDVVDDERYWGLCPLLSVAWGPDLSGVSLLGLIMFEADRPRGIWTYWIGPVALYYEADSSHWGRHRFPTVHRIIG